MRLMLRNHDRLIYVNRLRHRVQPQTEASDHPLACFVFPALKCNGAVSFYHARVCLYNSTNSPCGRLGKKEEGG